MLGVFIRSPEHNANLLDSRAKFVGSGVTNGFWTQDFGAAAYFDSPQTVNCPWSNSIWVGRLQTVTES
jgi:uncharacterized protein YkwD